MPKPSPTATANPTASAPALKLGAAVNCPLRFTANVIACSTNVHLYLGVASNPGW